MNVVGVDGCPSGWCVAVLAFSSARLLGVNLHTVTTFGAVLSSHQDAAAIAADIPIGLSNLDTYPRACDREARRVLGPRRGPSVFPAPPRAAVRECARLPYRQACARARKIFGRKLSQQTHRILPKIDEVDRCMTPALQNRVIEVHPEVCFWALNGKKPLSHTKKTATGLEERLRLLAGRLPRPALDAASAGLTRKQAHPHDIVDALVAAYTASCYVEKRFSALPAQPPTDTRGLRMEIVFPC